MKPGIEGFRAAGGVPISWRMATLDGRDRFTDHPTLEPRGVLLHGRGQHLGAVDDRQEPEEQAKYWARLTEDMLRCELCDTIDWDSLGPTDMAAGGYFGFYDEVPGARDIDA